MNNKLKGVGTAGLALLSTIPFSNSVQAQERPIPDHIQVKIDSAKAVNPIGIYDVMTANNPFANAPLIESDSTQTGLTQLETFLNKYVGVDEIGMFVKAQSEDTARQDFFDKDWQESRNVPYTLNDIATTLNAILHPMSATSPKNQEDTQTYFKRNELRQDWQTRPESEQNKAERIANYNLKLDPNFNPHIIHPGQRIYLPSETQQKFYNLTDRLVEVAGLPDVTQEYIKELEKAKDDKKDKIDDLEQSINRAAQVMDRQTDLLGKQEGMLRNWRLGPYAGLTLLPPDQTRYTIGLAGTTPKGSVLEFTYSPQITSRQESFDEHREPLPSNRPNQGEVVRETTTEDKTRSYQVTGGLALPITGKLRLGVLGGVQNNNLETNITDRTFLERDGLQLNEQQDNYKLTSKSTDPLAGVQAIYNVNRLLSLHARGIYNTNKGGVQGQLGVGLNIGGTRK